MDDSNLQLIDERAFETAGDFLDFLQLSNPVWGCPESTPKSPYIFRGHWDSDWELKPPAWREDGLEQLAPIRERVESTLSDCLDQDVKDNREWFFQIVVEVIAIKTFHSIADEQGLELPPFLSDDNDEKFWSLLPTTQISWLSFIEKTFSDKGFLETMALAQHHGVPTRLLDWTRDPHVAAFFAADEKNRDGNRSNETKIERDGDEAKRLTVWAVDTVVFNRADVNPLTVPRYRNAFLHAQEASFSYLRPGVELQKYRKHQGWPSLLELAKPPGEGAPKRPGFIKVTLPQSQVDQLLKLLHWQHITRSRLMPTYSSAADTSQTFWRISADDGSWFHKLFSWP